MKSSSKKIPFVRFLVLITNTDNSPKIVDIFHHYNSHLIYQFHAEGTSTSELRDILGLSGLEKNVMIFVIPEYHLEQLFHELSENLSLKLSGNGLLFTIPVLAITGEAMSLVNVDDYSSHYGNKEKEVERMKNNIDHSLIMVAANRGFSSDIVKTAVAAGATGGTVWDTRKVDIEEPLRQMGVAVQGEQEIIMMLVKKEKRAGIMEEIYKNHGLESEAQGMIFSLPVDNVLGLEEKSLN